MRWHGRRVRVYACARPTDMRKGFDGLCALVTQGLHRDPLSGDVQPLGVKTLPKSGCYSPSNTRSRSRTSVTTSAGAFASNASRRACQSRFLT